MFDRCVQARPASALALFLVLCRVVIFLRGNLRPRGPCRRPNRRSPPRNAPPFHRASSRTPCATVSLRAASLCAALQRPLLLSHVLAQPPPNPARRRLPCAVSCSLVVRRRSSTRPARCLEPRSTRNSVPKKVEHSIRLRLCARLRCPRRTACLPCVAPRPRAMNVILSVRPWPTPRLTLHARVCLSGPASEDRSRPKSIR